MASIGQNLRANGFAVIPTVFSAENCIAIKKLIQAKISQFMHSHNCTKEMYFSAVNRWPLKFLLDEKKQAEIFTLIANQVFSITGLLLKPFEADVLYKSPCVSLPTPCHQDISYVSKKPYLLSTWLALTEVSLSESPLQFLPGSHHSEILPAIDFWQPDFVDEVRCSAIWQTQNVTVPVSIGDALIFSSRIWHASAQYKANNERFALAIRWGNEQQLPSVPQPQEVEFGMWNCGKYTERLLIEGLQTIFAIESDNTMEAIQIWQQQFKKNDFLLDIDIQKAYSALEKLRVLNEAYHSYDAGDGQGIVYAEVWRELLSFLKERIDLEKTIL